MKSFSRFWKRHRNEGEMHFLQRIWTSFQVSKKSLLSSLYKDTSTTLGSTEPLFG